VKIFGSSLVKKFRDIIKQELNLYREISLKSVKENDDRGKSETS